MAVGKQADLVLLNGDLAKDYLAAHYVGGNMVMLRAVDSARSQWLTGRLAMYRKGMSRRELLQGARGGGRDARGAGGWQRVRSGLLETSLCNMLAS